MQNACLWKNGKYPKTQYENAQKFKEAQAIKRDEKRNMKTPKKIFKEKETICGYCKESFKGFSKESSQIKLYKHLLKKHKNGGFDIQRTKNYLNKLIEQR